MSNGGTPRGNPHLEQPRREPVAARRPSEGSDDGHLVPGDEHFHDDKQLISKLTDLNKQISRYVLRHLDAEAMRSVPTSPDDERALGIQLIRHGMEILGRAERRQTTAQRNGEIIDQDAR